MNFFLHDDLTDKIIKAYYKVYNSLGYGFLEKYTTIRYSLN